MTSTLPTPGRWKKARQCFGTVTVVVAAASGIGCAAPPSASLRASGYVEATEVRVAAKVGGRLATVDVVEGARVEVGTVVARLETTDLDLARRKLGAEHDRAAADLALVLAGPRPEDVRQAEAQAAAAAADRPAAAAELAAARVDEARYEQLLAERAGAVKPRDDARTRREVAEARLAAADERLAAARAAVERLRAGARVEEIASARARLAGVEAQLASLDQDRADLILTAPTSGVVSARLAEPGELVAPGTAVVVVIDLDRAWANVYLEEALIPAVRLGQPARVHTDAGDRLEGHVSFIAPRAEFTPRNVQTSDERARLVYRIKVAVDNAQGILKPGMPVEVDLGLKGRER